MGSSSSYISRIIIKSSRDITSNISINNTTISSHIDEMDTMLLMHTKTVHIISRQTIITNRASPAITDGFKVTRTATTTHSCQTAPEEQ